MPCLPSSRLWCAQRVLGSAEEGWGQRLWRNLAKPAAWWPGWGTGDPGAGLSAREGLEEDSRLLPGAQQQQDQGGGLRQAGCARQFLSSWGRLAFLALVLGNGVLKMSQRTPPTPPQAPRPVPCLSFSACYTHPRKLNPGGQEGWKWGSREQGMACLSFPLRDCCRSAGWCIPASGKRQVLPGLDLLRAVPAAGQRGG